MFIRQILPGDNEALASLIRRVFEEFGIAREGTVYSDPTTDVLFELFETPGSIYWVAEEQGEILGGCGIYPTPGLPAQYAELVKFYLSSPHRGRGIGYKLMERSVHSAVELGYTHLYLESFPELKNAVTMYERFGFKPLARALGNSGHYACTIWMVKELIS